MTACARVRDYLKDVPLEKFGEDSMRLDATIRNLELIGEAAKRLPDAVRDAIEGVPWREIVGMRNVLIHGYFGIDHRIVWSAATDKVPALESAVRRYLAEHAD